MRKRVFFISHCLHMLIVARVFTTHLLSAQIFLALVSLTLLAQYFKQGFTPIVLLLLPLLTLQILGELNENIYMQYFATILGAMLYFIPLRMYWLPEPLKVVGFRQDKQTQGGLHYFQFYPLDTSKDIKLRSIKWNIGKEVANILEFLNFKNKIINRIGHMAMSFADRHILKVGDGTELFTDQSIAFCHGVGGTPFTYASYLMHFAGLKFKVGAVQHHEVGYTGSKTMQAMKELREKEIVGRAAQFYQTILRVNKSRIVLMGHSYGSATIIQTYHSLQKKIKDRISHIILLDPWFLPLTSAILNKQINCPILILANEQFVKNRDILQRNKQFVDIHNVQYVIWKNAVHLHQTDLGFINGNLLGVIKNSHLSKKMLDLNIAAIDSFLRNQKVQGAFGEQDLGRNYIPKAFHPEKDMVF